MGDDMTNREAIKIVEYMIEILNDMDVIYDYEKIAVNQLIKTAKDYDEIINSIPHLTIDKSYSYEEIGKALHKVADSIGGHGGYLVSSEDIHKALEK